MKRLYRSRVDRKIGGICGGFGEYFDVDPTVIRLAFVFLALATGIIPFLVGYVIAWILVPEGPISVPQ